MNEKSYYVYIVTNKIYGTFYTGMTSNLPRRIWEHRNEVADAFTKEHNLKMLVYYEIFDNPEAAIKREKRLKRWNRKWKVNTIQKLNPDWRDLYEDITQ